MKRKNVFFNEYPEYLKFYENNSYARKKGENTCILNIYCIIYRKIINKTRYLDNG